MGVEIGLPLFARPHELSLIVDAVALGVKRSVEWVNAGQRWKHECLAGGNPIDALIYIIAVNLGTAHFSALVHVFGDRSTRWIKVVREADDHSGVCVPERPLQGKRVVVRQTDNYRLVVNRQAAGKGSAGKQPQVGDDDL